MANLFGEEWVENFQRPVEEKARDIAEFLGVDSIEEMSALEVLDMIAKKWKLSLTYKDSQYSRAQAEGEHDGAGPAGEER